MIHDRLQVPIQTLSCSKRAAAQVAGLKKSQLSHRLRRCRLAFTGFNTQRGKCDPCYCWGQSGRRHVVNLLTECRHKLEILLPCYWDVFDAAVAELGLDEWELPGADNPQYLKEICKYMVEHDSTQRESRAVLTEANVLLMVAHEDGVLGSAGQVH